MNYYSIVICFVISIIGVQAQGFVELSHSEVIQKTENQLVDVTLSFNILEGYHIQSDSEPTENSIATEITFNDSELYELVSYEFTSKHKEVLVLDQLTYHVLVGDLEVVVHLKLNKEKKEVLDNLKGQLYYQACTNKQCLFPRTLKFEVKILKG